MTSSRIAESLGGATVLGSEIDSTLEWIEALAHGFPPASVDAVIESGILTQGEADEYVIPRRTLSHRRQRRQRLSIDESDRLGRIARLTGRASETFGDQANAVAWLREPNGALGGARPLDMLRSGEGAILVDQILTRIDHGVYT
jgi:putative toxin-antitoxin system antitoxin component (TIGR02293 family)